MKAVMASLVVTYEDKVDIAFSDGVDWELRTEVLKYEALNADLLPEHHKPNLAIVRVVRVHVWYYDECSQSPEKTVLYREYLAPVSFSDAEVIRFAVGLQKVVQNAYELKFRIGDTLPFAWEEAADCIELTALYSAGGTVADSI